MRPTNITSLLSRFMPCLLCGQGRSQVRYHHLASANSPQELLYFVLGEDAALFRCAGELKQVDHASEALRQLVGVQLGHLFAQSWTPVEAAHAGTR